MPLPRSGGVGELRQLGVAACNDGQVVEVLGQGIVVECAAVVLQVAEGGGDASGLAWMRFYVERRLAELYQIVVFYILPI